MEYIIHSAKVHYAYDVGLQRHPDDGLATRPLLFGPPGYCPTHYPYAGGTLDCSATAPELFLLLPLHLVAEWDLRTNISKK